ncbi:hypothetical protein M422DRAFT_64935 [Sphaerobolus stellatus SS14]|nr:hypothetical protein M422DRAFT_64935 [Sphaerobolus stellatus SS14]
MDNIETQVYAPPPGPPPPFQQYAPPPGPPPPSALWTPRPLHPASFPHLNEDQVHCLSTQGFATFPLAERPSLHDAAAKLLGLSRAFFAQEQSEKEHYRFLEGNKQGSEEGWSRVIGEKELLTLRRSGPSVPPDLEAAGREFWKESGLFMQEMIIGVEESLGLPKWILDDVVYPECEMPEAGKERVETLLRMFRYERRDQEVDNAAAAASDATKLQDGGNAKDSTVGKGRLVAEPHIDLGLLTIVIGSSPGLEVYSRNSSTNQGEWISIEQAPYSTPSPSGLTATVLAGETLTYLTNRRFIPGRHRVFVPSIHPDDSPDDRDAPYRFSLVFALRPHESALLSSSLLTTDITGPFICPLEGVYGKELFDAISKSKYNVNTNQKDREAQKRRLQTKKPANDSESLESSGAQSSGTG